MNDDSDFIPVRTKDHEAAIELATFAVEKSVEILGLANVVEILTDFCRAKAATATDEFTKNAWETRARTLDTAL